MFRTLALFVAAPYSLVVRIRNILYDHGILHSTAIPRFVVVVGNLTLGGVGKTPFVSWLTRYCLANRLTPGLISRGYKAEEQEATFQHFLTTVQDNASLEAHKDGGSLNDEACELALRFPSTPHYLGSKRVDVANALITDRPDVDVLILDDAFQHRRVKRDLDVVVLDALNPFGGKRVAPAGFLREPLVGIKRAQFVILNRADLISDTERAKVRSLVAKRVPSAGWAEIAQRPQDVFFYEKLEQGKLRVQHLAYAAWRNELANKRVVAFCGLGAPQGFIKTLQNEKIDVADTALFPDHCSYNDSELETLDSKLKETRAEAFVTTVKDFVKLSRYALRCPIPIYAIGIGVVFISGQEEFEKVFQTHFTAVNACVQ